ERISHSRIRGNWGQDVATRPSGGDLKMTRYSRRSLLKASAAFAGASTLGLPSIVRAEGEKIKIGHLTPLTGFLGALGAYATLGMRMAEEEKNQAGGRMGRQLEVMSED